MGRPNHIYYPGALYHVIARGDNREPVFLSDRDYFKYLNLLRENVKKYDCTVLAYALMPNHIHLMIRAGAFPIHLAMQAVHTAYTKYVNRTYGRVGHVFQGRYKPILVEEETYALEVNRYIHLNPVRSGLTRWPEQYPWSSYGWYMSEEQNDLLDRDYILDWFRKNGKTEDFESVRRRFHEFTIEGLARKRNLEDEVIENRFLGSRDFIDRVKEEWCQAPVPGTSA
ncbi:MAG: transposase [Candidatus Omnitrophica bacterium]|nr:transposase [Candidatus Omnitrophota bacterium]